MTVAESTSKSTSGRHATINRDANGDVVGVAIFLTGDELASLGIEPAKTDAVRVTVDDGRIRVSDNLGGDDDEC